LSFHVLEEDTVFRNDVHGAYQDHDVDIDRILNKVAATREARLCEYPRNGLCVAAYCWQINVGSVISSMSYVPPSGPNANDLAVTIGFKDMLRSSRKL